MLNLKSVTSIAQRPAVAGAARGIVFDGRSAITVANARDKAPWWAGVPQVQAGVPEGAVAVPVDAIRQHLAHSRHLVVAPGHLHNGHGMRTEWPVEKGCEAALAMLPPQPDGEPNVECELVLDDLDRVLIVAGVQDIRPELKGVLLDFDTGAIVATDGVRLHVVREALPVLPGLSMVVPRDAARWMLHSKDERAAVRCWGLGTPQARVLLQASDGFVFAHAQDGKFPDWRAVVGGGTLEPKGARFRVDSRAISAAVEAMGKKHLQEGGSKLGVVCLDVAGGRVYAGKGPHFTAVEMAVSQPATPGVWPYFSAMQLQDLADCVGSNAEWALSDVPMAGMLRVKDGLFTGVVTVWRNNDQPSDGSEPAAAVRGGTIMTRRGAVVAEYRHVDINAKPVPEPEPCPAAVGVMADRLCGKVVKLPSHPGRKIKVMH
jgi:hypothetical protein